jgi:hypothetical protein
VFLRVPMPPVPAMRGEARNRARIGRKVAALFGIAGGPSDSDAGAGRAWLASYSKLTLNELLLGGPQRMTGEHPQVIDSGVFGAAAHGVRAIPAADVGTALNLGPIGNEAISPALVRGYGPDPKAALTLTGVNEVLRPLTGALIDVLTRLAFPDARLLMGTAAMLLEEAFRSERTGWRTWSPWSPSRPASAPRGVVAGSTCRGTARRAPIRPRRTRWPRRSTRCRAAPRGCWPPPRRTGCDRSGSIWSTTCGAR